MILLRPKAIVHSVTVSLQARLKYMCTRKSLKHVCCGISSGLNASLALGFIATFIFLVGSPIIMLGKVFGKDWSFSYGIMLGCSLNSSFTLLLAGLVLNTSTDVSKNLVDSGWWNSSQYSAYQATFGEES